MTSPTHIPNSWLLSAKQELVIRSLIDAPEEFQSPEELCEALYHEHHVSAPAKLRMLIQRCREIIYQLTDGEVEVYTRRGKGWRLTRDGASVLHWLAEDALEWE